MGFSSGMGSIPMLLFWKSNIFRPGGPVNGRASITDPNRGPVEATPGFGEVGTKLPRPCREVYHSDRIQGRFSPEEWTGSLPIGGLASCSANDYLPAGWFSEAAPDTAAATVQDSRPCTGAEG